eukprot:COSAG01_NODE_1762_length_9295_cov_7.745134_3_plen_189_part_00
MVSIIIFGSSGGEEGQSSSGSTATSGSGSSRGPGGGGTTTPTGPTCSLPGDYNGAWSPSPTGTPMFPQGATTTLTCHTGFQPTTQLGEATTLVCGQNGQWSHPAAQCGPPPPPPAPCSQLPGPTDSQNLQTGSWVYSGRPDPIDWTYNDGSAVTLHCYDGKLPSQPGGRAVCSGGQWSGGAGTWQCGV